MLYHLYRRVPLAAARLLTSERGQAFAEYAFLLSLITLIVIGALVTFGQSVSLFMLDAACYVSLAGGC